jgi:hypothetical protein
MVDIQFVVVKPGPGTESRRAHELRASAARSHASRVAHIRALQRRRDLGRAETEDEAGNGNDSPKQPVSTTNLIWPDQVVRPAPGHLVSALGQGIQDPFGSYDGHKLPRELHLALEDGE